MAGRGGEEGKASGSSVEGVMIIWMGAMEQDSSSPEGKATVKVLHLVVAVVKVVGGGGFVDLHRRAPAHRQGTNGAQCNIEQNLDKFLASRVGVLRARKAPCGGSPCSVHHTQGKWACRELGACCNFAGAIGWRSQDLQALAAGAVDAGRGREPVLVVVRQVRLVPADPGCLDLRHLP